MAHKYKLVQDIPKETQDLTLTEYTAGWLSPGQGAVQTLLGGLILLKILLKGQIVRASLSLIVGLKQETHILLKQAAMVEGQHLLHTLINSL